ncbi:class I SAM-dependent methyltransferase [Virgibacillus halophilus]|uniref:class I SAM-dependent methyltransferase n=1 Tax=Tigheibacillus halophilus TaxID=361280 RepID=UPI00363B2929
MSKVNYEDFYDKVGRINGWDFSDVKVTSTGVSWNFFNEVQGLCKSSDIILDIGTGGGESLLGISSSALLLVGIDLSNGMIETANANLQKSDICNVRFIQMDADRLQFPDDFFNVVSCRHSPFHANEIARVLKSGGTFITQQVCENDKRNLKTFFNRGQSFGEKEGTLKKRYVEELKTAGFSEMKVFDYDATEYYQRPEDLIFLLKHTPIIPNFGEADTDCKMLKNFIHKNETAKGIMTNSKRFMIEAKM